MTLELPSPALLEQHTSIDDLPEQFHESTKYWRADMMNKAASIASFLFDPLYIERSLRVGARNPLNPVRPLPDGPSPDMPLAAALQARASIRTFTPQAVTEDKVGGLLRSALAASRSSQVGEDMMLRFRPYPSGGGLYPIEFYLIAMNVEGLEAGIARYDPVQHGLQRLGHIGIDHVDSLGDRQSLLGEHLRVGLQRRTAVHRIPPGLRPGE